MLSSAVVHRLLGILKYLIPNGHPDLPKLCVNCASSHNSCCTCAWFILTLHTWYSCVHFHMHLLRAWTQAQHACMHANPCAHACLYTCSLQRLQTLIEFIPIRSIKSSAIYNCAPNPIAETFLFLCVSFSFIPCIIACYPNKGHWRCPRNAQICLRVSASLNFLFDLFC